MARFRWSLGGWLLTCKTLLSDSSPVLTSTFSKMHFLAVALVYAAADSSKDSVTLFTVWKPNRDSHIVHCMVTQQSLSHPVHCMVTQQRLRNTFTVWKHNRLSHCSLYGNRTETLSHHSLCGDTTVTEERSQHLTGVWSFIQIRLGLWGHIIIMIMWIITRGLCVCACVFLPSPPSNQYCCWRCYCGHSVQEEQKGRGFMQLKDPISGPNVKNKYIY